MSEIPDSPLSRHDLDVLYLVLTRQRGFESVDVDEEFVVSSRRVSADVAPLRVWGIPVRLSDDLGLNEGMLLRQGREPITFDFEA